MKGSASHRQGAGTRNLARRLLSLTGIREAIRFVEQHAENLAVDDTLSAAQRGELGDDIRELVRDQREHALDEFFETDVAQAYMSEREDVFLEELALAAGPKIAELWELSAPAGDRLADLIYWGVNTLLVTDKYYWSPLVLIVEAKDAEQERTLRAIWHEFDRAGIIIAASEGIQAGHIYLDVTYLPRDVLLRAYKAVASCRKHLHIRPQDLREGASASIDGDKALRAAALQDAEGSKKAAEKLGFRVYKNDNRAGSYPLFRKYAKSGRILEQRLDALDAFLSSLADNLVKP